MLQVEPAARKRRSRLRIAVALAGGGPLGAFYQLGCLHALVDCTHGLDLTHLDGYVGVSSGAIIAAGLANGIDTGQMVQLFFVENGSHSFPLTPVMLMRPALDEYFRRALRIPSLLTRVGRNFSKDPLGQNWAALLSPLSEAIPTGVFDNRPFEEYLRELLSAPGRTNDFRKLHPTLRIIATDLNSGEEVRFGEPGNDRVPISEAIRASTALPGLYTPVRIGKHTLVDGALVRTAHASLVLADDADLVISVNPLVTFRGDCQHNGRHNDLADGGFITVMNQTFRALIQSRMQIGMATYHQRYPYSDRLLFQPDRDDEIMFFTNIFRYSERYRLAEHAYQRTRQDLLAQADALERVLKRHGVKLRPERLRDPKRWLAPRTDVPFGTAATAYLGQTLERLSHWLEAR